ncbi:Membrane-associated 30 kDa protein, chloroplastic [Morella rubra]|uniref:Membrane-associated 30 kDa protein, chloroplastic n=1 Tax=Morella rubra TaxID=262757 RepID=A0A6A1VHG4_9ROSI|nr:Membrane-associated 30 kDa protein, chloroplastic [Morella rubra]
MGKKTKKPGKGKEKTQKKTAKAEEKKARRESRKLSPEDDIDAILCIGPLIITELCSVSFTGNSFPENFWQKMVLGVEGYPQELVSNIHIGIVFGGNPMPLNINPLKETELILYGGEFYNGTKDNANALKAQLDQQKTVVENLVSNTRLLESKIQEARSKKDTLKARAQSAKTASKVSEMLGNGMESQAEALGQLTTDDLDGKVVIISFSTVQHLMHLDQ